jgi:hypothetical protein
MAQIVPAQKGFEIVGLPDEGVPDIRQGAWLDSTHLRGVKRRQGRTKFTPLRFPDQASALRYCQRRNIEITE